MNGFSIETNRLRLYANLFSRYIVCQKHAERSHIYSNVYNARV